MSPITRDRPRRAHKGPAPSRPPRAAAAATTTTTGQLNRYQLIPRSTCSSEAECVLELKEANVDRVGLALKTEYGRHWYSKKEAKTLYPPEDGRAGSPY